MTTPATPAQSATNVIANAWAATQVVDCVSTHAILSDNGQSVEHGAATFTDAHEQNPFIAAKFARNLPLCLATAGALNWTVRKIGNPYLAGAVLSIQAYAAGGNVRTILRFGLKLTP